MRSIKKGNRICGKRTARAERVNPEMKSDPPSHQLSNECLSFLFAVRLNGEHRLYNPPHDFGGDR